MQSIISTFLRPALLRSTNPPVVHIGETTIIRKDYNYLMMNISVYSKKNQDTKGTILYCHSFGSNRYEAEGVLEYCVKSQMKLVTFEFKRVGVDGRIDEKDGVVTFGYKEAEQVQMMLDWVEGQGFRKVVLWGRSMGAVAGLRSQLLKPTVSGIILDSPYESLKQAIFQMIYSHTTIPNFFAQAAYSLFKPTIQQNLGFKIQSLDLGLSLSMSSTLQIPCIFIASKSDKLFGCATQSLYSKYKGPKQLFFTQHSHSSPRQAHVMQLVLKNILLLIKTNQKQKSRTKSKQIHTSMTSSATTNNTSLQLYEVINKRKKLEIDNDKQLKVVNCFGFCSMT